MKKIIFKIVRITGYVIGVSILLYPSVSNYINQKNSTTIARDYQQEISEISKNEIAAMLNEANLYNQSLVGNTAFTDPFTGEMGQTDELYNRLLNVENTGVMGYIEIPKIDILLPIYHGVSQPVLQTGAGHLPNTSLPVGGTTTHAVISGHRGLPSAKLFTDLNKLENGDVFYIKVLDQTLAYEVDQILTVLPEETDALTIVAGHDYVTLVTCTPYGINTHRLLVRGTRIPYSEAAAISKEMDLTTELPWYFKVILAVAIVISGGLLYRKKKEKQNEKESD